MSTQSGNSVQAQPFLDGAKGQQPAVIRRRGNDAARELGAAISVEAKASWMSPVQVLIGALIVAVLMTLIYYYTVTNLLQVAPVVNGQQTTNVTNGLFTTSNWLTIGGGVLFFLVFAIGLASAGATVGMSWKKNGDAAIWAMGATLLLSGVYYPVFAAAHDGKKDQFAVWSLIATLIGIAVPVYGWWQMRALANDAGANPQDYAEIYGDEKDPNNKETTKIKSRNTWSMVFAIIAIVSCLIAAAGFYKIYGSF